MSKKIVITIEPSVPFPEIYDFDWEDGDITMTDALEGYIRNLLENKFSMDPEDIKEVQIEEVDDPISTLQVVLPISLSPDQQKRLSEFLRTELTGDFVQKKLENFEYLCKILEGAYKSWDVSIASTLSESPVFGEILTFFCHSMEEYTRKTFQHLAFFFLNLFDQDDTSLEKAMIILFNRFQDSEIQDIDSMLNIILRKKKDVLQKVKYTIMSQVLAICIYSSHPIPNVADWDTDISPLRHYLQHLILFHVHKKVTPSDHEEQSNVLTIVNIERTDDHHITIFIQNNDWVSQHQELIKQSIPRDISNIVKSNYFTNTMTIPLKGIISDLELQYMLDTLEEQKDRLSELGFSFQNAIKKSLTTVFVFKYLSCDDIRKRVLAIQAGNKVKALVKGIHKCVQEALIGFEKKKKEQALDIATVAAKMGKHILQPKRPISYINTLKGLLDDLKRKAAAVVVASRPQPRLRPRSNSDSALLSRIAHMHGRLQVPDVKINLEEMYYHVLGMPTVALAQDFMEKHILLSPIYASAWINFVCSSYNPGHIHDYDRRIIVMILWPLCIYGIDGEVLPRRVIRRALSFLHALYDKYSTVQGVLYVYPQSIASTDKDLYREFRDVPELEMGALMRMNDSENIGVGFLCLGSLENLIRFLHREPVRRQSGRLSLMLPGMDEERYHLTFRNRTAKDYKEWSESRLKRFGFSLNFPESHYEPVGERLYTKILGIIMDKDIVDPRIPNSRMEKEHLAGIITGMILEGEHTPDQKFLMTLSHDLMKSVIQDAIEMIQADPDIWKRSYQQHQRTPESHSFTSSSVASAPVDSGP